MGDRFYQDDDEKLWQKRPIKFSGRDYSRPTEVDRDRQHSTAMFKEALDDMMAVIDQGGVKHGYGSWKDKDNPSLQHKKNCDSMFHHLAEHFMGLDKDPDSGVDPLLHLACRAMMQYTRKKRGYDAQD